MKKIYGLVLLSILGLFACEPDFDNSSQWSKIQNSPKSVAFNHLHYLQEEHKNTAQSAQSFPAWMALEKRIDLAIQLKQYLDGNGLYVQLDSLPDSTAATKIYLFPEVESAIYVEKVNGTWAYSKNTCAAIPDLHAKTFPYGIAALLEWLPNLGQDYFFGLAIWKWWSLLFLLVGLFLFYKCFKWLINQLLRFVTKTRLGQLFMDGDTIMKMARLFSFWTVCQMAILFMPVLQLPVTLQNTCLKGLSVMAAVFLTLLALKVVDFFWAYFKKIVSGTESVMDDQLLPLLHKIAKVVIGTVGVIFILDSLEVNVTALVAGISIGGLALALAAQDTVKHLIGSLMIFIDKPFQVGDYIIAGSVSGSVEEIGFRTTRIRASDTSLFAIPNGKIVDLAINNLGARVYRRYTTTLSLTYDTPPEKMESFINAVDHMIKIHPNTLEEKVEVHLHEFAASSLDIYMLCFFEVESRTMELESRQNIMLNILKIAKKEGVSFAFPTSTIIQKKESEEES